jgi:hypothetical protein
MPKPATEIWVEPIYPKNLEDVKPVFATLAVWNKMIKTGAVRLYLYIYINSELFKNNLVMKTTWHVISNDIGISTSTLHRYKQILHELKVLVTVQTKHGVYLVLRPQLDEDLNVGDEFKNTIKEYHSPQKRVIQPKDKKAKRREAFKTAPGPQDLLKKSKDYVITESTLNVKDDVITSKNNLVEVSKVAESPVNTEGVEKQGDMSLVNITVSKGEGEEKESKGTGDRKVKNTQTKLFDDSKSKINWPCKVSEVKDTLLPQLPLKGKGVHVSAIWYWALRRHEKHKLDFEFTMRSFQLLITKYYKYVVRSLGKDWEANKKYIDWYLGSHEPFIMDTCKYNPHFLTSTECLNKWHGATPQTSKIIETHEERQETGEWVK